jgi:Pyruvate/2-oxoacid:ferredoxin oxidoreductase delta subunit
MSVQADFRTGSWRQMDMAQSPFVRLAETLDTDALGVPKRDGGFSPAFLEYLRLLFTAEEAEAASRLNVGLPLRSVQEVAEEMGRPAEEVQKLLDGLVSKRVILGAGGSYVLPDMKLVVNYHQLREETGKDDIDAGELYQKFFIEDGFYRFYQSSAAGTPMRRAIPIGESIADQQKVLSHEEIDSVLDGVEEGSMALVPCPCRVRTEKLGIRECKDEHPVASCLFIGNLARGAVGFGWGKQISPEDAKKYVEETREMGLVMMVNNHLGFDDGIICFCCGCCCSTSRGITRWDNPQAFARSDFVARVSDECITCGNCVDACMFNAISLEEDAEMAVVDETRCMGCGVCTVTCSSESLKLYRLEREPIFESEDVLMEEVARENLAAGQIRLRRG